MSGTPLSYFLYGNSNIEIPWLIFLSRLAGHIQVFSESEFSRFYMEELIARFLIRHSEYAQVKKKAVFNKKTAFFD